MPRILSKSNLLVLAAFLGIGVDNVISADSSDYQILRNLYDATDGPNWKKNDGWSEDIEDDLCSWFGVECLTNTTSVFKLVLDDNELKGELPLEVLTLPKLDEFAIRRSPSLIVPNFEGITFAPHLKHLTFENAGVKSLSGIENATKLVALDISEHGGVLTGSIPDGLWDLTGLHRLWLDKNHLTGSISDKIGDIEGLVELDLHKNKLEMSIPKEIGQLVSIKKLSLGSNYFSGSIPTEIENLSSLEEVWFFENKLSGSLPKFENMSNLNKLEAQWNQLGGSISESFLKNTDSSTDMFIRLSHNSITGTIPGVLEKFESMTFHAEDNRFTGIESGLCNKGDWNDGWVDYYDCDGILCPKGTYNSYGRREKYKECHVCEYGGNDYLGSVTCNLGPSPTPPSSTPAPHPVDAFNGQKELLMELYNDLDGPNWNGNTGWGGDESVCKWDGIICGDSGEGVKIINLKGKGLMGTLPKSIFELPNLQEFNVHLNENLDVSEESLSLLGNNSKLTHVIFAGVKSLYLPGLKDANQLTYVDVSGNNIQGTIPNELFDLTNLKVLFLQDNEFSGSIPTKLNQLSNLEDVDFSGNKLEGELLIIDFVNLSKLGYLKLSFNYLTGTIPEEIFQHTPEFVLIHLDHNNFDGTLPSFSSSTTLASIDLSFNKLTGNIPDNFLDGMQDSSPMNIDLSHNLLAGTIPSLLGQFTALEINLVSNHFVAFDSTLCSDTNWAGEDSCDKVLCPLQTYNKYGREYDDTKCDPCETYTANYLGSTSCDGSLDDEVDKDILKEIYFECKGDNWVRNDGWNTDSNICNWYGVECTPATSHTFDGVQVPRVHKLDLQYNNVDCTESVVSWSLDQLFELSNLKILNMHGNPNVDIDFSAIPDLDNSAPVIEELLLAKVGIESADGVNYLQSLRHLDLSGNLLTIISPDIFKLTMLERLYLDQNQISGSLPTEIGYLTELESFDVFGNSITGTVPTEMMQLNNLKDVEMGHNKLGTTVEEVASIFKNKPKLWGLYFAKNDLTGRLDAFDQYPGLIELDLSNNKITGTIPSNFLFSVPGTRAHMKINLESNLITGTIPGELVRFDALQIDLSDNKISGIPPELCMKPLWQKGNTVTYGCDAILCKPGTSSMAGNAHDNINSTPTLCKGCDVASQVPYYGSTSCVGPTSTPTSSTPSLTPSLQPVDVDDFNTDEEEDASTDVVVAGAIEVNSGLEFFFYVNFFAFIFWNGL